MLKKIKRALFFSGGFVVGMLIVGLVLLPSPQPGSKIPSVVLMAGTGLILAGIAVDAIAFKLGINEKRRRLEREGCPGQRNL